MTLDKSSQDSYFDHVSSDPLRLPSDNPVRLHPEDISLLIGALVSDGSTGYKNAGKFSSSRQLDIYTLTLHCSVLASRTMTRNEQGLITRYTHADVLRALTARHLARRPDNEKALEKLNTKPFNTHIDINELMDKIAQQGVIQDDGGEPLLPHYQIVEYFSHPDKYAQVVYAPDFTFKKTMQHKAETFLKDLPQYVASSNRKIGFRENKFDDVDPANLRAAVDSFSSRPRKTSFIPFL